MRNLFAATACGLALAAAASAAAPSAPPEKTKPEMVLQMGHTSTMFSVAISPDGKFLLTGNGDNTAKLWDLATGAELRAFRGNTGAVKSVVFSPDGKTMATASSDYSVRVWEVATGKCLRIFTGHTGPLRSVVFSADGKSLLSGGYDNIAILWSLPLRRAVRTFRGHQKYMNAVALSHDGRFVVTGAEDGAWLWDAATGKRLRVFSDKEVRAVAVSADGKRVFAAYGTEVGVWDLATGKNIMTLDGGSDLNSVMSLAPSRDGKTLVTGHYYTCAQLWDLDTGARIRTFKGTPLNPSAGSYFTSVALSPEGKTFATAGSEGTASIWDIATGAELHRFEGRSAAVQAVAVSPDGRFLASAGRGLKDTYVWDLQAGERQAPLTTHNFAVTSLAFTPDSKSLIAGSEDNTAMRWELPGGRYAALFKGHTSGVKALAVSKDGSMLATASSDQTAKLWNVTTGAELRTFKADSIVTSVALSPDGKILVTDTAWAEFWDTATGEKLKRLPSVIGDGVAISPDGRSLATANSGVVKRWDMSTGEVLNELMTPGVLVMRFSPDGRMLATSHSEPLLWDVETGKFLWNFPGHTGAVWALDFFPDSKRLATGGDEGSIRIWDLASHRELVRLISVGAGWVVVTPEGYFDGSADGLKSIRWTVGLQSFPLEAFSEGYYVPGLLARVLSGDKIEGPKSLAQGFALPPLVKITAPADGTSAMSDALEVTVSAVNQGGGVDEIRLYQNGKALDGESRGIKIVGRARTFRVTLVDGENIFKAVALSRDRIDSNPDQIKVLYGGPGKRSRLHLLLVGVNQYKNADLNLNYAQPDAQSIADFFGSGADALFAGTTKALLFDARATKAAILAEFAALKDTPPQDVVVVYFAGHGESIGNSWYFVPYDLVYPEQEEEVKA